MTRQGRGLRGHANGRGWKTPGGFSGFLASLLSRRPCLCPLRCVMRFFCGFYVAHRGVASRCVYAMLLLAAFAYLGTLA